LGISWFDAETDGGGCEVDRGKELAANIFPNKFALSSGFVIGISQDSSKSGGKDES